MDNLGFVILALGVLAFGLLSQRLQQGVLTPPLAFVALGFVMGQGGFGVFDYQPDHGTLHLLAELTLVVVLFTDASRIDLALLRRQHDLPLRLLALGLPLTIAAGTLAALWLFPDWSPWEAALLAAVLAPTDAALGQAVVSLPALPVRIRQALNVESGLNDGIALPVVLLFFSIACATSAGQDLGYWLRFAALQLTLGPAVGIVVGLAGGRLTDLAQRRGWMSSTFHSLSALALALLAFAGADLVGGNGFIAAFCAGLAFGNSSRDLEPVEEFAEAEGQLLSLLMFTVFGAVMLPESLAALDGRSWLYALLSLTLIRMVPVALSLWGKGLRPATVLFLGWFGPRGIASILFALLVIEGIGANNHEQLVPVVMLTVLLSVILHGVTAAPLAKLYARRTPPAVGGAAPSAEHRPVEEMPLRIHGGRRP